jgi:Zn-dependent M16 (insulinase) family peptidase
LKQSNNISFNISKTLLIVLGVIVAILLMIGNGQDSFAALPTFIEGVSPMASTGVSESTSNDLSKAKDIAVAAKSIYSSISELISTL